MELSVSVASKPSPVIASAGKKGVAFAEESKRGADGASDDQTGGIVSVVLNGGLIPDACRVSGILGIIGVRRKHEEVVIKAGVICIVLGHRPSGDFQEISATVGRIHRSRTVTPSPSEGAPRIEPGRDVAIIVGGRIGLIRGI